MLEIKAKQKLTQYDGKEVRAAILLHYVLCEEKNIRLCMKTLAKLLGIKNKANFDNLHRMIGNYRGTAVPASKKSSSSSSLPLQRKTRSTAPEAESIIPRLAIRLSSLVNDPNGFSNRAQKLFQEVQGFIETIPRARREDYKREITQWRHAYEAACFYYVVSLTQTKKLSRVSSRKQQQSQDGGREDDHSRNLELNDLLEASPGMTYAVLKQVVKHLGELVSENGSSQAKGGSKAESRCCRGVWKRKEGEGFQSQR
jgi:hypothetical protein